MGKGLLYLSVKQLCIPPTEHFVTAEYSVGSWFYDMRPGLERESR